MGPCTSRVPLPLPLLLTTCSVLCLGGAAGGEKNCRASTGVCSGKGGVLLQLTANKSPAIGSQSSWSFTAAEGRAAAAALQMASALFKQASHVAVEERAHLRNSTEVQLGRGAPLGREQGSLGAHRPMHHSAGALTHRGLLLLAQKPPDGGGRGVWLRTDAGACWQHPRTTLG
mmetsp:Transcript_42332/g.98023  ORF Transcript_42332/g.98023 Transcript_42332/m.98023 type:complete len:173 (-) Transcript_42332:146-664(-)